MGEIFYMFWVYLRELIWPVAIGFLLSGILYEFLPSDLIDRHLGQKGLKPILAASIFGTIIPVCCFGTLPVAITLRKKGASLGAVLAFLVATPATSVSALAVCYKMLGVEFTVSIFVFVILLGIIMGLIGNRLDVPMVEDHGECSDAHCCCSSGGHAHKKAAFADRVKKVLRYAFWTLPKSMGLELLLGIAVASIVASIPFFQNIISNHLGGVGGYVFSLVGGLITYVCSTASVPIASVFISNGMSIGAGMTYLLAGPITSYGAILVIRKNFGLKVLGTYLGVICVASVFFGVLFASLIYPAVH